MTEPQKPLIIVNFKAYSEIEGMKALEMAKICASVSDESGICIAVCPPAAELSYVARSVDIPVFSQNADPHTSGAFTGWITPPMIKAAGAAGTLINHAEHRMTVRGIATVTELCKGCGLKAVICADTAGSAAEIAAFVPDMIAVEPPELIGGSVSVTDADPKIIEDTVNAVRAVSRNVPVLCGAGVKTGKDVAKALSLGASGVLLASGVIRSKDPRATLSDLVRFI